MSSNNMLRARIVDTAIELAEKTSWESVRMNHIANTLNISLNDIRDIFCEKEDIIDAWFDRADTSMLKTTEITEFDALETHKKLHMLLLNWLAAFSDHRGVTRQMILGKLEFGHIHYQLKGLFRISRTVQWWRDAAGISSQLPTRAIDETVLTALYLATFTRWFYDTSENFHSTSSFLRKSLEQLARLKETGNTVRRNGHEPARQATS